MLTALALLASAASPPPCPGDTTLAVNACLSARADAADAELDRYLAAAERRIAEVPDDSSSEVSAKFQSSQAAWTAYRTAECGALYDHWRGGTIRTAMALSCRIRLNRLRALAIWTNWLTYGDSTPPTLPRPAIEDQ